MPGPKRQPYSGGTPGIVEVLDEAPESVELPDPRPYQTRTEFQVETTGGVKTYEQWNWNKRNLAKWLSACPKATIFIPLDPNNDGDDVMKARPAVVRIDGIPIEIPKGRSVRVARPIAEIIQQSQQKFRTAQSKGLDTYTIKADDDLGRYLPQMGDADDVPMTAWKES